MRRITTLLTFLIMSVFSIGQIGPVMEICLVTVDEQSTHNIVVWERSAQISLDSIDSVKIYRVKATFDTLVGVVPWDSLSEFHDYSADPNLSFHRYRIAGVDVNGVEGPKSIPHQTMHFVLVDPGTGNIHLKWTPYVGHQIDNYNCWIDSAQGVNGWEWVNSTVDATDTAWWDNATPQDWTGLGYLVDVTWSHQCTATKAVDHNNTRSNRGIINDPASIGKEMELRYTIFPNPVKDVCTLELSSLSWKPIQIQMMDLTGRKVYERTPVKVLGTTRFDLDLELLNSGMYQIVAIQGDNWVSKPIVKE